MKDQLNRHLKFNETPKRIVSLVPSQTELLVDLGLEDALIGVTKFCVHPNRLRQNKTIVGGTKQVSIDKIKVLKPDIILCNKEENTKIMIEELEKIAPVHISDVYNIEDSFELICMYGEIFKKEEKAEAIVAEVRSKQNEFKSFVSKQPKLKVAYFIWKKPYMVAANQTFINEMLSINNFENVFENLNRYPEIQLKDLKDKRLDVILLSSEPYPFKEFDIETFHEISSEVKVIIVDGEAFSWYGTRLLKAFDYFKKLRLEI
ncbi:ABC transporter substrate-binding protein [Psychroserpens sp.]|uniref:ABC transporter substrate-binding protein n=1 Tax=Psychroserpens sp. TaxID=2020870 RepID=UPI00385D9709